MPLMDGIALALSAARDYPDLVILLMTAYADQRERAHGLEATIHDVIKPIERLRAVAGFDHLMSVLRERTHDQAP